MAPPGTHLVRSRFRRDTVFLGVALITLFFCVTGARRVPFHSIDGLDLMNLAHFHWICPESLIPYEKSGATCGDPLDRPMLYPPLLYWSFSWLRWLPQKFDVTLLFWRGIILLSTFFSTLIALRETGAKRAKSLWILLPLYFSVPMIYAAERANNDAIVLFLWCVGLAAFSRKKTWVSGVLWSAAAWMKVYPGIALCLVGAGLLFTRDWQRLKTLVIASVLTSGLTLGFLWQDHLNFIQIALPQLSEMGGLSYTSHPLYKGFGGIIIRLLGTPLWIFSTVVLLRKRQEVLALVSVLAISSFYPVLANDYSLITAYPLIILLGDRAFKSSASEEERFLFLFTVFTCAIDRTLYSLLDSSNGNALVNVLWFFTFPVLLVNMVKTQNQGNSL